MAGRRKKWLIAAALLVVVAALACAFMGRRGKMEVQLSFIGYTNYQTTFTNRAKMGTNWMFNVGTNWVFRALVLATNSGSVPMAIYPWARPLAPLASHLPRTALGPQVDFAAPTKVGAAVLKPGETTVVEVVPQYPGVPWYTEVKAQRRGFADRLYGIAWQKGGTVVRRVMGWFSSPPPEMSVKLGRITNAPPERWPRRGPALGMITNPPHEARLWAPTARQRE